MRQIAKAVYRNTIIASVDQCSRNGAKPNACNTDNSTHIPQIIKAAAAAGRTRSGN